MNFGLILLTLFIFFVVFTVHIILFRTFRYKRHISLLFKVTLGAPFLLFCLICSLNLYFKFASFFEILAVGLLFFSLAFAYIQTYPPIQVFAPSLRILYLIGKTKTGLTEEEIRENFSTEDLITDRLDDLFTDNFIYEDQSGLYLKPKGRFLAFIFGTYRNILGLDTGEG